MEAAADEERPLIQYLAPEDDEASSRYTSDGTLDINKQRALKKSTGNWRACFMILGTEFAECLAFYATAKNLVTYLTAELGETNIDAATNVSTWIGSCYLTPLIGAFLADTYWGRYKTMIVFLLLYIVGMLTLTASAWLPLAMEDDSPDNSGLRRATAYLGLYLVSLGTGGIKPCTAALGADQFDGGDAAERVTKASFFNWYYFCTNIGSLLSGTVLVWVQENIGWGVGFTVQTVFMLFGLAVFVAGRKVYRYKKLGGSPLTRVAQVVVAAVRNCHLVLPDDTSALYHDKLLPTEPNFRIESARQFRFFDKAAIITGEKGAAAPTSPWRLCTVSQVEELKMLLRLLPVWASMVLFFAVSAQTVTTFIEQARVMDNRIGPFIIPPASIATFDVISVMVCVPVYDAVLVPLARRATGNDRGLSQLHRLSIGIALSVVVMVYAALLEGRRLALARANMPAMNIAWQAPMFAVHGAAAVFATVGVLEFFYDQSPDGMKSLGNALALLSMAAGSYFNSLALSTVGVITASGGERGWLPDDLNKGHMDYFFWMMAALGTLNLLHFLHYCNRRYTGNNNTTS